VRNAGVRAGVRGASNSAAGAGGAASEARKTGYDFKLNGHNDDHYDDYPAARCARCKASGGGSGDDGGGDCARGSSASGGEARWLEPSACNGDDWAGD
jgi:hypothetical protein